MNTEKYRAIILQLETGNYDGYYYNQSESDLIDLVRLWDANFPEYTHVYLVAPEGQDFIKVPDNRHLPTIYRLR